MQKAPDTNYEWIELDDKPHWWTSLLALVGAIAIATVLIAPWIVDLDTAEPTVSASTQRSSQSYCRPQSGDLPRFLNPSVASWTQFCEWFIEPNVEPEQQ